jgi:hypothetical protein
MRALGIVAKRVTQLLLLPVTVVVALEAWWQVSARNNDCACGCGWENNNED